MPLLPLWARVWPARGGNQYYNLKGPPTYVRSVVDQNMVMRSMTVVEESLLLTHSTRTLFTGYQLPYTQQT
jgi:hypothetical protein